MTDFIVSELNSILVVDSRLIAKNLGIEHRAFMQTLKRRLDKLESRWGVVTFEMDKPLEGSLGGRPEKYALLNEPQATFLMTLSKNTQQVENCKLELVDAFEKAKTVIKTVIPAQSQEIERLKLQLSVFEAQKQLLEYTSSIAAIHGLDGLALIMGKPEAVVTQKEVVETTVTVNQDGRVLAKYDGVGITYLAARYKFGKGAKANNACRAWLHSIGIADEQWQSEASAHAVHKLPRTALTEIDKLFAARYGDRQIMIGEKF